MRGIAIVTSVLAAAGCVSKKKHEEAETKAAPQPAVLVDRWFAEPDEVSAALASATKRVQAELRGAHLVLLKAAGIDEQGRLHPRFGKLELEFQRVYDPDLPIGAPLSAHEEKTCLVLTRGPDGWTGHQNCGGAQAGWVPKCTARTIWKRAVQDGAPATGAIAQVTFESGRWHFAIDDPRAQFRESYADDCEPEKTAEAGGVGDSEDITYRPIAGSAPTTKDRTGDPICDELVARTLCTFEKTGPIPADSTKAFEDAVEMWRDALKNETTRQSMIDACKSNLDASKEGWAAMGC